jgi:hypothetical protein
LWSAASRSDGVLDGSGDLDALKMPSGRGAMIERMQAMMGAAETVAPRIVSTDEAIAGDLQRRHGERALLIEARQCSEGGVRMLAVLDLDRDALAAEQKRLATPKSGGPAVEVIDRATWLVMRRLQLSGMLQLVEGPVRVLHRAREMAEADGPGDAGTRPAELRGQAERALRMARVLAVGGFPEEAPTLLAKAIGHAAAARLAVLGELSAGVSTATPVQIRDLVERKVLPPQAATTLAALWPAAGVPSGAQVGRLLEATEEVLAACDDAMEAQPSVGASRPTLQQPAEPLLM